MTRDLKQSSRATEWSPLVPKDNSNPQSRHGATMSQQSSCSNLQGLNGLAAQSTKRKLWFAVALALLFFTTELIAGYFSNSLALMSDAFHLMSDVASFVVALAAIYLAEKPATSRHTYGFHRAEVIAALASVMTIWVLTGFLVYEAIQRVRNPQVIDARLMCITATMGVAVNLVLAYVLGGHHHHHHHKHDPESGSHKATNINLRAAALHVLGDLLASIGVLISSVILIVKPTMTIVDPICTFVFAILVLYTTFHLIQDSVAVLMEGSPSHLQPETIAKTLMHIPGVVAVHDMHVWALSPGKISLTAHIIIEHDNELCYDDVLERCQRMICNEYDVHHSTLQIESERAQFTSHCRPDICHPRML